MDGSAGGSRCGSLAVGTRNHADAPTTILHRRLARLSIFVSRRAVPAENCAAAAGLGTALGSASAGWPDGIWASSVGLVDALIRTYYGIYEFTDDPKCILRVALGQARTAVTLSDGTRVENGELIGTLHFWNEHLPRYAPDGPNLHWACAIRDQMRRSLCSLAEYVERERAWREIRALRGEAALSTRLGILQVQRVGDRYGFERVTSTNHSFLQRLHSIGEAITLWSLTRAFNPAALSRQPFIRDHHELWISRSSLLEHYGPLRRQAVMGEAQSDGG
jgi:hypothetical protein